MRHRSLGGAADRPILLARERPADAGLSSICTYRDETGMHRHAAASRPTSRS
ncbi:hypothetical protein HMPREF0762_00374 [Slackia exigua ATCC 700122]|uniref:Uncharacterized protein n=1 Tax=Slackia exigua (strain ATCC 700122 / DSM 15923 / CIP 105133 / JCM 11022 / KCTC 5966 / S-7) TaxID=649764 RepID=D0WEY8_SLAES|nr:hypothetical protein HMPREF0762_00374 [Slackia exigua ATCC 700122]